MAGVCNTCTHFRSDVHPNEEKLHHCDYQDAAVSESDSQHVCEKCVPEGDITKG